MPKLLPNTVPSYRLHKQSGQAVVTLNGRDFLLGPHGTPSSRAEYRRRIAEWEANDRVLPQKAADLTISELIAAFRAYAIESYQSSEPANFAEALRPLRKLYGPTPAADFGPLKLEAVRNQMVTLGWVRTAINRKIGRIKMVFKWAVSRELVPPAVYQAIATVTGLRFGRSNAKESEPVKPVADGVVDDTAKLLHPTVKAMVQLQRLTGARPGEICNLKVGDIDRTGDVWKAALRQHKTRHHGHDRSIFIGPKAQAVLQPYMMRIDPDAYVFSPAAAEAERRAALHEARKTPDGQGNEIGTHKARRPRRPPGERYDAHAYARAITRACEQAFPPPPELARQRLARPNGNPGRWEMEQELKARLGPDKWNELKAWRKAHHWHPHQLRHTAATDIGQRFGLEAAQHVLGHSSIDMTQIYAERDADVARSVAKAIG